MNKETKDLLYTEIVDEEPTQEEKEGEVISCLVELMDQDVVEQTGGLYRLKDLYNRE
jgi:hypothetical protein